MGSLHKNIQLLLEFLKAPFLVLHFSHHTLMAFLMMLSAILLLMMVLSKSDQACDKWQQLQLAAEHESGICNTLWTGAGTGLLSSLVKKNQLISFD